MPKNSIVLYFVLVWESEQTYIFNSLDLVWVKFHNIDSVTRLGDLLHFEQLFKDYCSNYLAQIAHIFLQFL